MDAQQQTDLWVLTVLGGAAAVVLYFLGSALLPLFVSCLLAYVLLPLIEWLERRGLSRVAAVASLYALFSAVLLGAILYLVPVIGSEFTSLRSKLPAYSDQIQTRLVRFQADLESRFPELKEWNVAGAVTTKSTDYVAQLLQRLPEFILNTFTLLSIFVLIPIFTWYLLVESRAIKKKLVGLFPNRYREVGVNVLDRVDDHLSRYLAGQVVEALVVGVLTAIGYSIIGVPFGLVVGLAAGFMNIIPYVGFLSGAVIASMLTVLEVGFTIKVVEIAAVAGLVHMLDALIIQPNLLAKTSGLHPLTVLVVLLVGGHLFGIWGMVLGIPAVGAAKILLEGILAVTSRRKAEALP